jgi:hypothetical protein
MLWLGTNLGRVLFLVFPVIIPLALRGLLTVFKPQESEPVLAK